MGNCNHYNVEKVIVFQRQNNFILSLQNNVRIWRWENADFALTQFYAHNFILLLYPTGKTRRIIKSISTDFYSLLTGFLDLILWANNWRHFKAPFWYNFNGWKIDADWPSLFDVSLRSFSWPFLVASQYFKKWKTSCLPILT